MIRTRKLAVLLAVVMVFASMAFGLTSCGKKDSGGSSDSTTYTLKWAHVSPAENDKQADAINELIEQIKEESDGRLIIEHHPAGDLGQEAELFEGVQNGSIEIATLSVGSLGGFVKDAIATTMPFLFNSREEAWEVFDGDAGTWLADQVLDQTGVRVLGWAENGLRCFTTTKNPVKTPDDLKGLKIRTQQNPMTMAMVKALGATPQAIDFAELYTALQNGTVDGQENPPSLIYTNKLSEVQKNLTLDYHVYDFLGVFINPDKLAELPEDLQEILVNAIPGFVENERNKSKEYDARDIEKMKEEGVAVVELTDTERQAFVDKTADIRGAQAKKESSDEAVDKFLEAVKAVRES